MSEQRIQTVCLLVLTTFAIALSLRLLSAVMIPFVLAVFLTFGLLPVVELFTSRLRLPRVVAIALVFVLAFFPIMASFGLLTSSIGQLSANADRYQEKIHQLAGVAAETFPTERFGFGADEMRERITTLPVGSTLMRLMNSVLQVLSNTVLVVIFVLFLLLGSGTRPVDRSDVWRQIESRIERYLVTKFVLSSITGMSVALILYLLGVDLALMFGFLAFLLNFIPSVGSIIATLLPLPMVALAPEASWTTVILALVLPGTVQVIVGNGIEPKIMGESLDLHPATILIALILWGVLWGIVGMFLATPITAVLKIVLEQHELTRPAASLMAGHLRSTRVA